MSNQNTPLKKNSDDKGIYNNPETFSGLYDINDKKFFKFFKLKKLQQLVSIYDSYIKSTLGKNYNFQLVIDDPKNLTGEMEDLKYGLVLKIFKFKEGVKYNRKCQNCIKIPNILTTDMELIAHLTIHYLLNKKHHSEIKDIQKLLVHVKFDGQLKKTLDLNENIGSLNEEEKNIYLCLKYIAENLDKNLKEICFNSLTEEQQKKYFELKIEEYKKYYLSTLAPRKNVLNNNLTIEQDKPDETKRTLSFGSSGGKKPKKKKRKRNIKKKKRNKMKKKNRKGKKKLLNKNKKRRKYKKRNKK